jgi:serine protease inhibitor
MKNRLLVTVVCIGLALACARKGVSATPASGAGAPDPAASEKLVRGNNEFGLNLFRELFAAKPGDNIFISPTSIALALGMTWNGALGETKQEMADVLGLSDMTIDDVSLGGSALLAALQSADPKVLLEVANSLWVRQGFVLAKLFTDRNRQFFSAEVTNLDFADRKSVDRINGWVAKKTHDKIKSIISELSPEEVLILINAVYFKGTWTKEFDKKLTMERDFHMTRDALKKHPMMSRSDDFRYYEGEGMQMARLPYGDGRLGMLVFLPKEGSGIADFVAGFSAENVGRWVDSLRYKEGEVVLPRFKLEYDKSLSTVLKQMGMARAFSPQADFGGMLAKPGTLPFYISDVLHKTFVEVNEEGTEAAAVTAVKMMATAMPGEVEKFVMVCNRPFVYAIHDEKTGSVLFIGALLEPKL